MSWSCRVGSIFVLVLVPAALLVACGTMEKLPLGGGSKEPKSLVTRLEPEADNALRLTVETESPATLWLQFSAVSPENGRIRLKVTEPAGWLPTSEEKPLAEVETRLDGTFPKAASFPNDGSLDLRLRAEFQTGDGRWQPMSLVYPTAGATGADVMPPTARESSMLRWAVHGDEMNGMLGVKLRVQ